MNQSQNYAKLLFCTFSYLLLLISLSIPTSAQETTEKEDSLPKVSSTIEKVTVYLNGAKINRKATANVPEGISKLVLENISSSAYNNSLQVNLKGKATLLSATYQINYLKPIKETAAQKVIKDSLASINYDLKWLQAQREVLSSQQNLVQSNMQLYSNQSGVQAAQLTAVSKVHKKELLEIKKQMLTLEKGEQKIRTKRNDWQKQLRELKRDKRKPTGEVVLQLSTTQASNIDIDFSYVVSEAGWNPLYDLRSEGLEQPVTLIYKANVYQNTGFDWEAIDLTISTGNPSQDNNRPILSPIYSDFYVPPVAYNNQYYQKNGKSKKEQSISNMMQMEQKRIPPPAPPPPPPMSYSKDDAYGEILEEEIEEDLNIPLNVNTNQLNVEFEITTPYEIPSNGKEQLVEMKEFEINTSYQYHAVPKLSKGAFLLAKVTNWGQYSLLPAPANIFFEGAYVGESQINPSTVSDTLLLSLGRDDNIAIRRIPVKSLTATKLMGSNKRETKAFEIIVRNNKTQSASVEILDQIPISKHKDIQIKLVEKDGAKYLKDYGKLLWQFELAPGKTKKIRFVYEMKYPKNKKITCQ